MTRWKLILKEREEMLALIQTREVSDKDISLKYALDRTTITHHRLKLGIRYDSGERLKYFNRKQKSQCVHCDKILARKDSIQCLECYQNNPRIQKTYSQPIAQSKYQKIILQDGPEITPLLYKDYLKIENAKPRFTPKNN